MVQTLNRHRPHPEPIRITGFGVAITVNLAALLFFSLPRDGVVEFPTLPKPEPEPFKVEDIRRVEIVPVKPVPAFPQAPELVPPKQQKQVPPVEHVLPTTDATKMSIPVSPNAHTHTPSPTTTVDVVLGAREAQVAYIHAPPPRYPPPAVRKGIQGVVLLRVLVGSNGLPRDVEVAESSGHGLLDRAAVDQVLQRWRFDPARQHGQPVDAWVEIPIEFTIPR